MSGRKQKFRERFYVTDQDREAIGKLRDYYRQQGDYAAVRIALQEEFRRLTAPAGGDYRVAAKDVMRSLQLGERGYFHAWVTTEEWSWHMAIMVAWNLVDTGAAIRFAVRVQAIMAGVSTAKDFEVDS